MLGGAYANDRKTSVIRYNLANRYITVHIVVKGLSSAFVLVSVSLSLLALCIVMKYMAVLSRGMLISTQQDMRHRIRSTGVGNSKFQAMKWMVPKRVPPNPIPMKTGLR